MSFCAKLIVTVQSEFGTTVKTFPFRVTVALPLVTV